MQDALPLMQFVYEDASLWAMQVQSTISVRKTTWHTSLAQALDEPLRSGEGRGGV